MKMVKHEGRDVGYTSKSGNQRLEQTE